ncbi:MAG: hypothetical protein ABWX68_10185, partial [Arthrobacter sp.]
MSTDQRPADPGSDAPAPDAPPTNARAANATPRGSATADSRGARAARELTEAARESDWSRPSFAKGLYLGRFDWRLVHPHPVPDAALAARGADFLERLA